MAEQIGRYEIRRELGRGGMATVYLAFDPRIRRQVAIKVLPRQFTHDPKYLDRFQQEAQTIATLEHPAIVPIYDFGEHSDAPYLVMRYMAGGSLRDRLSGEPLSLEEIAAMLDRLAPALDYAHEVGVIHRDLKPANILFDHLGSPYLADFGIARLAEASQTMTIIGTPAYMSPEQVESKLKLDGRSDVYAMGVILYELLTGEQPYVAETPTGQMLMHITKPVPDILAANPDLPAGAQVVIEKAMAKDREQRYQSAAELATAVKGLLAAENTAEAGLAATSVAAEAVTSQGAAVVPDEPPAGGEPQIEGASADDSAVPPVEAGDEGGGLPGWVWWLGALALLLIAVLGIRAIFGDGAGEEPVVVPTVEETESLVEVEATATEDSEAEEESTADTATLPLDAELGAHWVRPADSMTMVHIPAGTFPMGSKEGPDNETPLHEVSLDAFWIDRTEVTNARYALCVNDGGCVSAPFADDVTYNGENYPVVGVSWFDAEAYCEWADARLPTEAEWEYAARGPHGNEYPWGNEEPVCDLAQFADCSGETIQAGSLPDGASWAGVLDMSGNVREWVNDWYDSDYYANAPERNPHGPGSGESKVLRGGAWDFTGADYLRGASRELDSLGVSNVAVGFRCVVALDSSDEGMLRDIDDDATPVEEAAPVEGETAAGEGVVSEEPAADVITPPLDAELGEHWVRSTDDMTMVYVPEGSFTMGSEEGDSNETPLHEVTLDAFWIDRTEVTNAQYALCENDGDCEASQSAGTRSFGGDDFPVVDVSWFDAKAFCEWADGRLPSEAEWEYAARGPEGSTYPWGDDLPVCDLAHFDGCGDNFLPAGSLPDGASWVGALDMAGNVWEWINDWFGSDYYVRSAAHNPQGPQDGDHKVLRGGAWTYVAHALRGADRDVYKPEDRSVSIGFRCVFAAPSADEETTETGEVEKTPVEEVSAEEEIVVATVTPTPAEAPTVTMPPTKEQDPTPTATPNIPPPDATLGDTWERPTDGMTMVYVPEGSFPMGGEEFDNEKPVHDVKLDAFWIDRTEVTNAHFAQFAEATGHETTAEEQGSSYIVNGEEWLDTKGADWQHPQGPGSSLNGLEDHPVVLVSWFDAEAYCAWADARLPTEAEWEYAARGPEGLVYPWGDSFDGSKLNFCDANCSAEWRDDGADDDYKFTAPAGSYPEGESWAGAVDMSGNAFEWVNDWYGETYYTDSPRSNPQGPNSGDSRVLRGGSWGDDELHLRDAGRGGVSPDGGDDFCRNALSVW